MTSIAKTLKLIVATTLTALVLGAAPAHAEEAIACADKQAAVDTAKQSVKDIGRVKYAACKGKKGDERDACRAQLKTAHDTKKNAARARVKAAKATLKCCQHPKAKACVS